MEFKRKNLQSTLIIGLVLLVVIASGIIVTGNSNLTEAVVEEIINNTLENIVEGISKIEVWANTLINLKLGQNSVDVSLSLDNGTMLSNQEIEFYLNESLISSQLTDSKGYTELIFNPNTSPGTYSFRVEFQGNPNLYLNPSFVEEQIEVIGINGTLTNITISGIFNQTNQTLLNITNQTLVNQTIEVNISIANLICKNFTDNVLFSSGYTYDQEGSTNYETWKVQTDCVEAGGQDCSLFNVNTKSRVLYVSPYDDNFIGEGYVQISELSDSEYNFPDKEKYEKYLVHNDSKKESGKWERYCGKDKENECESENAYNYQNESNYYGIKTYASQYSIIDVVEVSYTWCWRDSE